MAYARRTRALEYDELERRFTEGHVAMLRATRDKLIAATVERMQCLEFAPPHLKVEFEEIVKRDVYEMLLDVSDAVETVAHGGAAVGDASPDHPQSARGQHGDAERVLEEKVAMFAEMNARLITDGEAMKEKLKANELMISALQGQVVHRDALLNKQRSVFLKQLVEKDIRTGGAYGGGGGGAAAAGGASGGGGAQNHRDSLHSAHPEMFMLDMDTDLGGDDGDAAGQTSPALVALERKIEALKESHERERQSFEKSKHDTQLAHMQEVEELKRLMRQMDTTYKEMLANAHAGGDGGGTGDGGADAGGTDGVDDATRHNPPPVPISVPGAGVDVCIQCDPADLEPRSTNPGDGGSVDWDGARDGSEYASVATPPPAGGQTPSRPLSPAHPPAKGEWEGGVGSTPQLARNNSADTGTLSKRTSASFNPHPSNLSSHGGYTRPSTPGRDPPARSPPSHAVGPTKPVAGKPKRRTSSDRKAPQQKGKRRRGADSPSSDDVTTSSEEATDTTGNDTTTDEDDSSQSSRSSNARGGKKVSRTVKASAAPRPKQTKTPSVPKISKRDSEVRMRGDSFRTEGGAGPPQGQGQLPPVSPHQPPLRASLSQSGLSGKAAGSGTGTRGGTSLSSHPQPQRGSTHSTSNTATDSQHPTVATPMRPEGASTPTFQQSTTPPQAHSRPRLSDHSYQASQQPHASIRMSHDSTSTHTFTPRQQPSHHTPHASIPAQPVQEHPPVQSPPHYHQQQQPRPLLTKTADTMVKAVEARYKKELAVLQNELAIKEQVLDQVLRDVDSLRQNNADSSEAMGRLQQYKKIRQQQQQQGGDDQDDTSERRSEVGTPVTPAVLSLQQQQQQQQAQAASQNFTLLLDLRKEINMKNRLLKEKQVEIDTMSSNLQTLHGAMAQRLHTINLQIVEKVRTSVQTAESSEEVYRVSGWTLLAMGVRFGQLLTNTISVLREDPELYQQDPHRIRLVQRAVELMEHRFAVAMASQRHERSCLKDLSNRNWDRVLFYARSMVQAPREHDDPPTHQLPFAMTGHNSTAGGASGRPQTAPYPPSPSVGGRNSGSVAAGPTQASAAVAGARRQHPHQRPSTAPGGLNARRDDAATTLTAGGATMGGMSKPSYDVPPAAGPATAEQRREKVLALLHRDRKHKAETKVRDRQKKARDAIAPIFGDAAKVYRLVATRT